MPKLLNKIWIHAFMLFAMLVANNSVSAIKRADTGLVSEIPATESTSLHNSPSFANTIQPVTSHLTTEVTHLDCPNTHQETEVKHTEHSGCSSVCLLKMPPFKASSSIDYQHQSLALIEREPKLKPVLHSQTLLRPPIS